MIEHVCLLCELVEVDLWFILKIALDNAGKLKEFGELGKMIKEVT